LAELTTHSTQNNKSCCQHQIYSTDPSSIPGQSTWELWWTNGIETGFSPNNLALLLIYHSTNAP